ncbi:MAG: prolyl oligopeptidase family serine peptidase [Bacteroidetes bacterium]|nr:prolyl oligopeptidase family serine peptidase [Bacteroidota bacterium]MDA0860226.1 prolyl oligopeptidase family serine peptidase [Bacteroidota bacterium]MDA1318434.1 prolyl oligopeptidase family serine peptidase [Bacteroidota bacterium]
MIVKALNKELKRVKKRSIVYDLFYNDTIQKAPLIIFCHGYKGFKDWGAWNLLAEAFALQGIAFLKFNFSHNGGTVTQPVDFPDLAAFAENNYSKELDDLDSVIEMVSNSYKNHIALDVETLILMGHSRGGGVVTIKTSEDSRVKKLITLAGVSDYKSRFPQGEALKIWQEKGVYFIENGRTKQKMPHNYQFYQDFIAHENRLSIENAATKISIPHLIVHGDADPTVPFFEANQLKLWSKASIIYKVRGGDHVFGAKHPWEIPEMPRDLELIFSKILDFINN